MLELMDLSPCRTVKEGTKKVQETMQAGIFTNEELQAFVELAFHEVHGPGLNNNNLSHLQECSEARIESLRKELALEERHRSMSQILKTDNRLNVRDDRAPARFVFKSEAKKDSISSLDVE